MNELSRPWIHFKQIEQPYDEKFEVREGNTVRNLHLSMHREMPQWCYDEPLPKPPVKLLPQKYLEAKRQYTLDYPEHLEELQKMGYFRDDEFPEWEERWQKARPQRDRAKGRDEYITIAPVAYDELRAHKAIAGYRWYSSYKTLNKRNITNTQTATYEYEHFQPYWKTRWEMGKKEEYRMATSPEFYWQAERRKYRREGQHVRMDDEYEPSYCSLTGKEGLYDQEEVWTTEGSPIEADDEVMNKTWLEHDPEKTVLINNMVVQQLLSVVDYAIWWVKNKKDNNIWIAGKGRERYIGYYRLSDPRVRQARRINLRELAKIVGCHRHTMERRWRKIESLVNIMQFLCQYDVLDIENWLQYSERGEKENLLLFFNSPLTLHDNTGVR